MNNEILLAENKLRKGQITIEQLCEVAQKYTLAELNEVSTFLNDAKTRLRKYLDARPTKKYPVKKYICLKLYTDVQAYEVVRQISRTKIEVRELDTKAIKKPTEFYAGGFAGHYADNHNQTYEYTSNENNRIETIRLSKNGWGKGRWVMRDAPYKFYDFNF